MTNEQVETNTQELQVIVDRAEKLKRLQKNRDFKEIIQGMYLDDGSKFLVKNLNRLKDDQKQSLIREMEARSALLMFIDDILDQGNQAMNLIAEGE